MKIGIVEKIGFSLDFCIYNRKKVVWVSCEFLELIWIKMLILVDFDDIGFDIWFFGMKFGKCGFFNGFLKCFWGALKLSWCVDDSAIVRNKKQNICSSFCHLPLKTSVFPHFTEHKHLFVFLKNWIFIYSFKYYVISLL